MNSITRLKILLILMLLCNIGLLHAAKKFNFSSWQGNHTVIGEKPYDYFGHSIV
ncbi:MAG: hypothetical protein K8R68_06180 [Bacteroidales bacterium]|nr:hypothetical protein [Bacteroidales bacterium]